jgi:hypothetical protein
VTERDIATDNNLARYHGRHRSTQELMICLAPNPMLEGVAMDVSQIIWLTAQSLVDILLDGSELSAGLRKLLEAKDCLARQGLRDCGVL